MRVSATFVVVALFSCTETKTAPVPAGQHASPNASLLPAPLAAPSELAPDPHPVPPDAAPSDSAGRPLTPPAPPVNLAVDKVLSQDGLGPKDASGYSLTAEFRFGDVPGPANVPEVATTAVREKSAEGALKVTIDLAASGRLRLAFEAAGFSVPPHSELRARAGYYGHVLVWPGGEAYRNVQPGALRALFEEARLDVSPLLRSKLGSGAAGSRLGRKTVASTVETSLGVLSLEQAVMPQASGGDLLCRLLAELVGAEPSTEACRQDRIPFAAHYRWTGGGSLGFTASALAERKDLLPATLAMPPDGARFLPGELPLAKLGALLGPEALAELRTRPAGTASTAETTFHNQTSVLQYLLLDGVPVAGARPRARVSIPGVVRGRYTVLWRDFFGTATGIPELLDLPAALRAGTTDEEADGGT